MMVDSILKKIVEISEEYDSPILISEQTPKVLDISRRVYVLEGGEIRVEGEASKLKSDENIIKVYLGVGV
jgi:branched-chain amino acid transport system ATP-binding protein